MLKARLPTQQELTDLYREVDNLRKDKKLKDDTIKFLQKEKEALMRELKHYESLCDGVVTDITTHRQLEADNTQLKADILHLKDIIRRQNSLLRNTGTSGSNHLDRSLVTRMCANLLTLLDDVRTPMSDQVCSEIEHQKEQLERASQKKGETAWHFLEIIDRALMELKSGQKKKDDFPTLKAKMSYSQGNPVSVSSSYNGSSQSSITEAPPPVKQAQQQSNLMTTNSTSLANLSSGGSETLVMAGQARKRSGNNNNGKLGRIGRGMERSRSAPTLNANNGFTPKPPRSPAPKANKNMYKTEATKITDIPLQPPINKATVNMQDITIIRIPGMMPHPPSHLMPRPPNAPPPSNIKNIYHASNDRPVNAASVNMFDTPVGGDYYY